MQLQDGVEGPSMQLACSQEYPSTITAVATSGLHGAAICAGLQQWPRRKQDVSHLRGPEEGARSIAWF